MPDDNDPGLASWDEIPRNLWHRYRTVNPDGTFGGLDRAARRMLLDSGWRDPQTEVAKERGATTGYWWANEKVPMRIDQALVTGPQIKARDYLTHDSRDLRRLSDHLPMELTIEL